LNDTTQATAELDSRARFVAWLRNVAPYVHAHRGRTFVVGFGGELIEAGRLNALVQDLSLLHAMGIRLVLVHGSRPQVQAQIAIKGLQARFERGVRITDAGALECAKEAAGEAWEICEVATRPVALPMDLAYSRMVCGAPVQSPLGILVQEISPLLAFSPIAQAVAAAAESVTVLLAACVYWYPMAPIVSMASLAPSGPF